jgi:hypothetical protein
MEPVNYDPESLTVIQQIGTVPPSVALTLGANVDALFQGEGGSLPSTVILDYVYGVAAYKSWHSNRDDVDVMDEYHKKHYAPRAPSDDTDDASEPDEPSGSECKPSEPRKPSTRTRRRDAYPWNHARRGCRAQAERNRPGGAGSSGSEPKQSDRVEETYGRLMKCIHRYCLSLLHTVSAV